MSFLGKERESPCKMTYSHKEIVEKENIGCRIIFSMRQKPFSSLRRLYRMATFLSSISNKDQ